MNNIKDFLEEISTVCKKYGYRIDAGATKEDGAFLTVEFVTESAPVYKERSEVYKGKIVLSISNEPFVNQGVQLRCKRCLHINYESKFMKVMGAPCCPICANDETELVPVKKKNIDV